MMYAINNLASQQAQGTIASQKAMLHFLDYCATHPDATVCYHASERIL